MAGRGTRVAQKYKLPKPLIYIHGRPLFGWALAGLPLDFADELHIITSKNVAEVADLEFETRKFVPSTLRVNVKVLVEPTSGQAATVMAGLDNIDPDNGILIFNCDTIISNDFPMDFNEKDGILGTFKSDNPGMSYIASELGVVSRTAEKERISRDASSGLYYFGSRTFFERAYANTAHQKETFIAPLYNSMIADGLRVSSFEHRAVVSLGTGAEISWFESLPISQ
ncbi:MAG: NTP transferase domain-containing protein [Actinobacteria bacterium]|nr:NTP transferase domain-containing protein [Actinomycetota bacterium]